MMFQFRDSIRDYCRDDRSGKSSSTMSSETESGRMGETS